MRRARPSRRAAALALALAALLAGCGKGAHTRTSTASGPVQGVLPAAPAAVAGAVTVSTRNTTRLGGSDPLADAAAIARVVYPGVTEASRPQAVTLVDSGNWAAALAASALAAAPLGAPLVYAQGSSLPAPSAQALEAMRPTGARSLGGAQVIRIGGGAGALHGYVTRNVPVGEPAVTAAAVEALLERAAGGHAPHQVIVVPANAPQALQMPAAGLAAQSGAPILFVNGERVPFATAQVLERLHRPSIYVIGAAIAGARTMAALALLGHVTPITAGAPGSAGAVADAIAVARFTDGTFGWGVKEPGHGLVFASALRPLDAPAAAPLSASADYGPLLLLAGPGQLPGQLAAYLSDIQPAYTQAPQFRPVRGVYNHGWVIGDESAIARVTQAEIDALLEISPRKASSEEPSVSGSE